MVKTKDVRGDKLRDIIFYVYQHDQFSKDKIKVSDLKKTIGYSTGGVYGAFESGYLEKVNDEIHLTEEGQKYVKNRILPKFEIYRSYGTVLLLLGFFFFFQWFEWNCFKVPIIPEWYFVLIIAGFGIFLRFFIFRFNFFISKKRKKIEHL
jgi:hypothetical protein